MNWHLGSSMNMLFMRAPDQKAKHMPKKRIMNTLIVAEAPTDCDVLNLYTRSKKAHFSVPMPKLYESIMWHIHDNSVYFQVRLSVYPLIAVHIYGSKQILQREKATLIKRVEEALADNFDNGVSKIKRRAHYASDADAKPGSLISSN